MYNWSVDEKKFKAKDPLGYKIWCVEQTINYGLGDDKLDERAVRKYWKKLYLDPIMKDYLIFLLWPPSGKVS